MATDRPRKRSYSGQDTGGQKKQRTNLFQADVKSLIMKAGGGIDDNFRSYMDLVFEQGRASEGVSKMRDVQMTAGGGSIKWYIARQYEIVGLCLASNYSEAIDLFDASPKVFIEEWRLSSLFEDVESLVKSRLPASPPSFQEACMSLKRMLKDCGYNQRLDIRASFRQFWDRYTKKYSYEMLKKVTSFSHFPSFTDEDLNDSDPALRRRISNIVQYGLKLYILMTRIEQKLLALRHFHQKLVSIELDNQSAMPLMTEGLSLPSPAPKYAEVQPVQKTGQYEPSINTSPAGLVIDVGKFCWMCGFPDHIARFCKWPERTPMGKRVLELYKLANHSFSLPLDDKNPASSVKEVPSYSKYRKEFLEMLQSAESKDLWKQVCQIWLSSFHEEIRGGMMMGYADAILLYGEIIRLAIHCAYQTGDTFPTFPDRLMDPMKFASEYIHSLVETSQLLSLPSRGEFEAYLMMLTIHDGPPTWNAEGVDESSRFVKWARLVRKECAAKGGVCIWDVKDAPYLFLCILHYQFEYTRSSIPRSAKSKPALCYRDRLVPTPRYKNDYVCDRKPSSIMEIISAPFEEYCADNYENNLKPGKSQSVVHKATIADIPSSSASNLPRGGLTGKETEKLIEKHIPRSACGEKKTGMNFTQSTFSSKNNVGNSLQSASSEKELQDQFEKRAHQSALDLPHSSVPTSNISMGCATMHNTQIISGTSRQSERGEKGSVPGGNLSVQLPNPMLGNKIELPARSDHVPPLSSTSGVAMQSDQTELRKEDNIFTHMTREHFQLVLAHMKRAPIEDVQFVATKASLEVHKRLEQKKNGTESERIFTPLPPPNSHPRCIIASLLCSKKIPLPTKTSCPSSLPAAQCSALIQGNTVDDISQTAAQENVHTEDPKKKLEQDTVSDLKSDSAQENMEYGKDLCEEHAKCDGHISQLGTSKECREEQKPVSNPDQQRSEEPKIHPELDMNQTREPSIPVTADNTQFNVLVDSTEPNQLQPEKNTPQTSLEYREQIKVNPVIDTESVPPPHSTQMGKDLLIDPNLDGKEHIGHSEENIEVTDPLTYLGKVQSDETTKSPHRDGERAEEIVSQTATNGEKLSDVPSPEQTDESTREQTEKTVPQTVQTGERAENTIPQTAQEGEPADGDIVQTALTQGQAANMLQSPTNQNKEDHIKNTQKADHSKPTGRRKTSKKKLPAVKKTKERTPKKRKTSKSVARKVPKGSLPVPTTYSEAERFFVSRPKSIHTVFREDWNAKVKELKALKSKVDPGGPYLYPRISNNTIKFGILYHLGAHILHVWHAEDHSHSSASYVGLEMLRGKTKLFFRASKDAEYFLLRLMRFFTSPEATADKIRDLRSGRRKADIHWIGVIGKDVGFKSYTTRKELAAAIVSALDYDGRQDVEEIELSQEEKDKILTERKEKRKEAAKKSRARGKGLKSLGKSPNAGIKGSKGGGAESSKSGKSVLRAMVKGSKAEIGGTQNEASKSKGLVGKDGERSGGSHYKNLHCTILAIIESVYALKDKPCPFRTGPTYESWKVRHKFVPSEFLVPHEFLSQIENAKEDEKWVSAMAWSARWWRKVFSTEKAGMDMGEAEAKAIAMAKRLKVALDEGEHEYFTRRDVIAAALGFGYCDFDDLRTVEQDRAKTV